MPFAFHLKIYEIWFNRIKDTGVQRQEVEIRAVISKMLGFGSYCLPEQLGLKGLMPRNHSDDDCVAIGLSPKPPLTWDFTSQQTSGATTLC